MSDKILNNYNDINLFSNKQELFFKITKINDDKTFQIKFIKNNYIINNCTIENIESGNCFIPNFKINNKIKYLFHDCYNKVILCSSKKEFYSKYRNYYSVSVRNGWLFDLCLHIKPLKNILSKEQCHEKALLCESRIEFKTKYNKEYQKASRLKCLDEICSHMIFIVKKWTKQECHEKSLLCKSRIEFQLNYRKYYHKARLSNWLNEICSHMNKFVNQLLFPRIIYVYEFLETKHVYVGLTKNLRRRNYIRKKDKKDIVNIYHLKTKLIPKIKILTKFLPALEAQKMEEYFVNYYKNNGWNILNRTKTGSLGGNKFEITEHI